MKTFAVLLVILALLLPGLPQATSTSSSNYDWWLAHYDSRLAEIEALDNVELPSAQELVEGAPEFAALVAAAAQRTDALGIDLQEVTSGAGEEGTFPLIGDSLVIHDYFSTAPPPPGAECRESGLYYDHIFLDQGPYTTAPDWGMIYIGDATNRFATIPGFTSLAVELPPGTYNGVGDQQPVKAFFFDVVIYFLAESDFWCYEVEFCFFGFCYYETLVYPYIRGIVTQTSA